MSKLSNNKKAINYKTIGIGLALQFLFAIFIFKVPVGQKIFLTIGHCIEKLLEIANVGGAFVFGPFVDNKVLGKPQDQSQAFEYLKMIQGNTHTVITALALYNGKKHETTSKVCKTKVTFAPMTDEEIQWYVDSGEWHGAAGGYRIQSLASCFIEKIEGSYSGVIGLPIFELYDILKQQGYSILE